MILYYIHKRDDGIYTLVNDRQVDADVPIRLSLLEKTRLCQWWDTIGIQAWMRDRYSKGQE